MLTRQQPGKGKQDMLGKKKKKNYGEEQKSEMEVFNGPSVHLSWAPRSTATHLSSGTLTYR